MIPCIVYSKEDKAGVNIASCLKQEHGFSQRSEINGLKAWESGKISLVELETPSVHSEDLDLPGDYYIFASRHRSETGKPCFTVHPVGNWSSAELGGREQTLSPAFASKMRVALGFLAELASKKGFDWQVCMEATHHGPFSRKPILFVEIGSSEQEWVVEKAGELVAQVIMQTIDSEDEFPTIFGAGGGHYAPVFSRVVFETGFAVGHVLPKYQADAVEFEAFKQGVEKCVEKVDHVLLDRKGLNSGQRKKINCFCDKLGLECKRRK